MHLPINHIYVTKYCEKRYGYERGKEIDSSPMANSQKCLPVQLSIEALDK